MAIGNSYPVRPILRAQDLFLGTQYGSNNTVNYTTGAIVDYLNTNASIAIGGQLTFKFLINEYESKSIFFPGGGGDNTSFSSITQLLISNADCSGNETNIFLEYLEGTDILISEQNHPNIFGHYKITSYTATVVPGFYTIDLEYIGGNGSIQEDIYYNINSFILASNSNTPTLQQVTDAGDTTTTTVHLDGGALSDSVNEQASFSPSSISTVNKNTGSGVELGSIGYVGISPNGLVGGYFAAEYVTEDVTLQFPNKPTGTYFIATTDDINTQGLPAGGTAGQILTKVDSTDYNATWQENYADWTSQVKHIVKNNGLSGTITKGTAVYVTGSNGTNMLVGRASNTSEATSSKTMGLMQSDITTTGGTQTGFVITEGLLDGLNTAGHVAGEPVWLGVDGALIYGLANKPYAPAHLVFIGIVTKISAGNGEIFVKVQNGFELKEIHDVDIITTTPINGHLLGFDGTLWVNKTIASWLGFTPVTDARTISTTAPLSGGGDLSANRTLSISQATTSTDGYLSSANWNTFNNKFTLPALTSGSVLFSNGSTITQDNANLFWDDTNNRLGIGTNAPTLPLDVNGQARIVGTLNLGTTGTVGSISLNRTTDGTTVGGIRADSAGTQIGGFGYSSNILLNNGTTGTSGILFTTGGERMRIFGATGNVAINSTTDAGYRLDVNGTARVKGTGTTSATTAFVVQDSAGANTFQVRDDGQFGKITPTSSGIFNIAGSSSSSAAALFQNGAANFNGFRVQMNAQTLIDEAGVNAFVTTSAILELKATTKGFLPPRMTTTQKNAIATPAAGLVVYDTTLGKLCVRGAAAWETITSI